MKGSQTLKHQSVLVLGMLLGGIMLTSCQGVQTVDTQSGAAPSAPVANEANNAQATETLRARPQLIKRQM